MLLVRFEVVAKLVVPRPRLVIKSGFVYTALVPGEELLERAWEGWSLDGSVLDAQMLR